MLYRVRGPACKDLCVPYCVHVDWSKEPRLSKPPFSHQMEGVKDPILSAYRTNLLKQQECAVCDSWCGGDPGKMIASVKRLGGSQGGTLQMAKCSSGVCGHHSSPAVHPSGPGLQPHFPCLTYYSPGPQESLFWFLGARFLIFFFKKRHF